MNSLISINSYKDLLKKNHVLRTVYLLIKFRGINLSLKILKNYFYTAINCILLSLPQNILTGNY